MLFSTVLAFSMAALPFLVVAVPVSPVNSPRAGRPISVPMKKHVNHLHPNGTVNHERLEVSLRRAEAMYETNTGKHHPRAFRQGHSNKRRSFLDDSLTNHGNLLWTAAVQVGTPPQGFNLVVDTTQSASFIDSVGCLECSTQRLYNINSSSSGVSDNINQPVNFGSGSTSLVIGISVTDIVSVAQLEAHHSFIAATQVGPSLTPPSFPADGILGFGFGGGGPNSGLNPFFQDVIDQGQLQSSGAQAVFGMTFDSENPSLVLGGTDSSRFLGSLADVSVVSETVWQILIDSIKVNGSEIYLTTNETIIDTSSPFVMGDNNTISHIYSNIPGSAQIPNSGQWTIPCSTNLDITITIGSSVFNVSPPSYILGPIIGSNNLCTGGFSTADITTLVLGTAFLRNVYTNFDIENKLVGFAPLA